MGQRDERHLDRSLPNLIILRSILLCMCLYVGVQETFSTISGLAWEAVLYLNSKQSCLAFSERRDNLLRADVFVFTSVTEVSGSPKLPLCAGLIATYLRKGYEAVLPFYKARCGSCLGNRRGPVPSNRGRAPGQSQSVYCSSPPIPISVLCGFVVCSS